MEATDYIFGIRAVIEAIDAGRDIDKVLISKDLNGPLIGELLEVIKRDHVVMRRVPVEKNQPHNPQKPPGGRGDALGCDLS